MTERQHRAGAKSAAILSSAAHTAEKVPSTGLHLYARIETFTSRRALNRMLSASTAFGSLFLDNRESGLDVETFLQQLFHFEKHCVNNRTDGREIRYLSVIQMMLPQSFSERHWVPFAQHVAEAVLSGSQGVLPYFLRAVKKGECTYLLMFAGERYYYPEGRVIETVAGSDFYRNPATGRRCKADTPGAVLAIAKGSVTRRTVSCFSSKEIIFRGTATHFKALRRTLFAAMKDYFSSHAAPVSDDALFPRLNYDDAAPKLREKCRIYNSYIQKMEKMCTELLDALKGSGYHDSIPAVEDFIVEWRSRALRSEGSVRSGNHSFPYRISFQSSLEKFDDAVGAMFYGFEKGFERFSRALFPVAAF